MRPKTLQKIDDLHAQIEDLIREEKQYHDQEHPAENDLWRTVAHTKIEIARYCPMHRSLMVEATLTRREVKP